MYDALGGHGILDGNGNTLFRSSSGISSYTETDLSHAALVNPIRWKCHYYDQEMRMYMVGNRYYDPMYNMYISAENPENLFERMTEANGLDRHGLEAPNTVAFFANPHTIFTVGELFPDPAYDKNVDKSWLQVNWKKAVQLILLAAVILANIILAFINPAAAALMFVMCLESAASGVVVGGVIGGIVSAKSGNNFWDGVSEGMVNGLIDGYIAGGIMFGVKSIVQAVRAANAAKVGCEFSKTSNGRRISEYDE